VIVGGIVTGTWSLSADQLVVDLFAEGKQPLAAALTEEVARLATILGRPLRLTVQSGHRDSVR
jgi:hypothetical protein